MLFRLKDKIANWFISKQLFKIERSITNSTHNLCAYRFRCKNVNSKFYDVNKKYCKYLDLKL